ncbi:MAG TPA: ABC transporter permease [Vicinamibacterales bacterium]|nr:ABC transporter permease [Vicinamibacterales bacterium]
MREPLEGANGTRWFEVLAHDLRFGARTLRKAPAVTGAAVLTLALGVGFNTAIFSVVESILLNQLPYRDPAAIVTLTQIDSTHSAAAGVGEWTVNEWRRRSRSLETISTYNDAQLMLTGSGDADVLRGMRVSAEFFDTLGVKMLLGRAFVPEDDRSPRANVIILSHELWSRRFGADPSIVGRLLQLNAAPYRVIGVLPADFHPLRMSNPAETPQFFSPAGYDEGEATLCRTCYGATVIARLKPSMTVGAASAELQAVMHAIAREYPSDYAPDTSVRVAPLRDELIGSVRMALWVLFGAVALVLLMACANVASFQLARATARTKEFALRAALGGGRSRLIRQLLTENLLLAVVGGAAGVLVGSLGTAAIVSFAPRELPRLDEIHMDGRVLLFALSISLLTGLAFGTMPAWSASRVDVNEALKRSGGVAGRSSGSRRRHALVVIDLALAFALVVATGLLGRSFQNLTTLDAGFNPHDVLTLTPAIGPSSRLATADGRLEHNRQIIEKVRIVPGVTAVGMVSNVPLSHSEPMKVRIDGQSFLSDAEAPTADVFWVAGDYFRALAIPLRRGRFLTDRDGRDAPLSVLVSESFARIRFPGTDPIGRRIQLGPQQERGPWSVIVGIVGDVRYDRLDREPGQAAYQPQAMNPFHYARLVARTAGDPWRFEHAIRAAIREVDSAQAVFHVQPMDDYVASSLADRSFALALIALFGVLALLLSSVGIYGVVSYAVVQRTAELGVRAALGASRTNLFALILRQALAVTGVGLALGLLIAIVVARVLASFLFGVEPFDPKTLAATAGLLAFVAALASYLPARAATRIDPQEALRAE